MLRRPIIQQRNEIVATQPSAPGSANSRSCGLARSCECSRPSAERTGSTTLSKWAGDRTLSEAMAAFEAHEVAAAPVYDFLDRVADEQLAHREVFISVDDQQLGHMTVQAPVPRFSATRRSQCRGLPGGRGQGPRGGRGQRRADRSEQLGTESGYV